MRARLLPGLTFVLGLVVGAIVDLPEDEPRDVGSVHSHSIESPGAAQALVEEPVPVEQPDSYERELANFAAAAAGTTPPWLGREDALQQARVIEALYRSAATGEAVTLGEAQS